MSILQDLDPKYAKMHADHAPKKWKPIVWIAGAILLLLWATWVTLILRRGSEQPAPANPQKPSLDSKSSLPETPKTFNSYSIESTPVAPPAPATIISGDGPLDMQRQRPPGSTRQKEDSLPEVRHTLQSEHQTRMVSEQQRRPTNALEPSQQKTSEKKKASPLLAKQGADSKDISESTKKAAERDVDIISAIVR